MLSGCPSAIIAPPYTGCAARYLIRFIVREDANRVCLTVFLPVGLSVGAYVHPSSASSGALGFFGTFPESAPSSCRSVRFGIGDSMDSVCS